MEPNLSATCELMAQVLAHIVAQLPANAHLNYLSESDESALHNMDEEEYRRKISTRNR